MAKRFSILIIAVSILINCSSDSTTSPESVEPGVLTISITDSYADISSLLVNISEIAIHKDNEWIIIDSIDHSADLIQYNSGDVFELFSEHLESGHYNQIRLMIEESEIIYKDETYPVMIPSSWQTGLKLVNAFDVSEEVETSLVLDFDVLRAVHITGPPGNLQFVMRPTIRVIEEDETGRITGEVTNLDTTAVAYAFSEGDTVAASPVQQSGIFVLAFLPEGTYSVLVEDANGLKYENESVFVENRKTTNLGEITIQ
ncbi:hypothetical protein AMJ80_01300 [bacterium SM23_31]|nr:MAG: hypothetical protein AMJ80_01300 [bacterium SM23_31]